MAKEYLIGDFLKRIKRSITLLPELEYRLVTIKMNHNGIVLRGIKKGCEIKSNMFEIKKGDFILSGIDARNGAFGIVPDELDGAIVTNDFWYFELDERIIIKELFLELTATNWFDDICKKGSDGTTQRIRLQKNKFFNQKILLPEKELQNELLKTLLSFKEKKNILDSELQNQKQLISQLKQSILQEAIQGKLTADWRASNPEPAESASELLSKIKAEKRQLIKDGKIKKEKPLPTITPDEIPFELPEGWVWCRLGEVGNATNFPFVDGPFGSSIDTKTDYVEKGVPVLRMMNIKPFNFISSPYKYINEEKYQKFIRHNVLPRDILFAKVGAGIGESCIVPDNFDYGMLATTGITRIRVGQIVSNKYLCYFLNFNIPNFMAMARQSSQPFLNMTQVKSFLFPLPSMEEQKIIVSKVESLMQKVSALETEITQSEQHAQMLMQAVLKEAFEEK